MFEPPAGHADHDLVLIRQELVEHDFNEPWVRRLVRVEAEWLWCHTCEVSLPVRENPA